LLLVLWGITTNRLAFKWAFPEKCHFNLWGSHQHRMLISPLAELVLKEWIQEEEPSVVEQQLNSSFQVT
jgi:hypothetical protein